jgi:hypothetical protein
MATATQTFDPDAFLSQGTESSGFDPNAFLASPHTGQPTVATKVANLAGDIGAEASVSMFGQGLGAATGPGYFAIAPAAGLVGNYWKQQREIDRGERQSYSVGEGIASALINLIPGGSVAKAGAKTATKIAGEELAQSVIRRGMEGAAISSGGKTVETLVEEKRFPTYDEYLSAMKAGGLVGGAVPAIGAGMEIAGKTLSENGIKLWNKLAGKTETEIKQTLTRIAEKGSNKERQAATELIDTVGQDMGLVRPAGKSAEQSAGTFNDLGLMRSAEKPAEESAVNIAGREAVEAQKQRNLFLSQEIPAKYGSETYGSQAGSKPAPVATPQEVPPVAIGERPIGGFGSQAERIGSEVSYPANPAAEAAASFQRSISTEAPQTASLMERAIQENRTMAGAIGLRERLAAEQLASVRALQEQRQALIRAGDYGKARELESISREIEARRLTGSESIPSEQVLRSTVVKPGGKVGGSMGSTLPTTEDIIQEFQNIRGVGGRQKGMKEGFFAAAGAGGLAVGEANRQMNQEDNTIYPTAKEAEIGQFELDHPYLGTLRYPPNWTKEQIQSDVNNKEVEYQKIQAAAPQLQLREKFEQANGFEEKMAVLTNFASQMATSPQAAGLGTRLIGGAINAKVPPLYAPITGAITELAALTAEGGDVTKGKLARAAFEAPMSGVSGEMAKNILKFAGVNLGGAQIEEYLDRGDLISLDTAAKQAALGGAQGALVKYLDKGKLATVEAEAAMSSKPLIRTLTLANENGLVVDPVMFSRTAGKKAMLTAAGGSNEFQKYASIVNEPKILQIAKKEAGIATDLGIDSITARRKELSQVYEDVGNLSTRAGDALDVWKQANADAKKAFRDAAKSGNPADAKLAREHYKQAQDAFNTLKAEAVATGNSHMVNDLEAARKNYAKLFAVEAAVDPATGKNFDVRVWGDMFKAGVPMDGNMETLGRLASAMPQVMQDTRNIAVGGLRGTGITEKLTNAALSMTGIPKATRAAMASAPMQALNFLPSLPQGTPDYLARFATRGASAVNRSIPNAIPLPQDRPIPYR